MSNWLGALDDSLSQGDVVRPVPLPVAAFEMQTLQSTVFKGNRPGYVVEASPKADHNDIFTILARGPVGPVVVLSHSCELDKEQKKGRVIVTHVRTASKLAPDGWARVVQRERLALIPLPGVPELGDCYADLREMTTVDRRFLALNTRLASMGPSLLAVLQQHVAGYFSRDR